jgi:ESS family glutamate:Na+ symporter
LRAKIKFFQKFMIPSCLIGGFLGLLLLTSGVLRLPVDSLETAAYHFFNISFISVGLTRDAPLRDENHSPASTARGALWMALTQSALFPLQAVVGGLLVIFFGWLGVELFPTFGFFAPLGFEEGPGQALSFGKVWEGFGFEHAATIGLTFAAVGFFFAFFVGVPLVNRGLRRGLAAQGAGELPPHVLRGLWPPDRTPESAGSLTLHSSNLETLAFQSALIGLVYLVNYFTLKTVGSFLPPDVASLLWAFFFLFGLALALLLRWGMRRLGIDYLVDAGLQRRITGWSVDFLLVATIMAIKLAIVWQFILPIGVISISCGVLTTALVVYLGRRLWSFKLERTAAVYGAVTGTVSSGLLLLRIVDPEFKTPVVKELALMNVFSIPAIGVCSVLINGPIWWNWQLWQMVLLFFAISLLALALIRIFKLWGKAGG